MEKDIHVCPPWVGKLMINPLRKLYQNPKTLLNGYIHPGYKVLEIGPGMGFFSLPMAKMVGETGKIYCVDIQQKMLEKLANRAAKDGLSRFVETIKSDRESLNIENINTTIDFVLLFAVVHEVPDKEQLFKEVAQVLKKGGYVFFAEPKGHVSDQAWNESIAIAKKYGMHLNKKLKVKGSLAVLLSKM